MNIKEFLKPTKKKILYSIILTIIPFLVMYILNAFVLTLDVFGVRECSGDLELYKWPWNAGKNFGSFCATFTQFYFGLFSRVLITFLVAYTIVCIIFKIFKRTKLKPSENLNFEGGQGT